MLPQSPATFFGTRTGNLRCGLVPITLAFLLLLGQPGQSAGNGSERAETLATDALHWIFEEHAKPQLPDGSRLEPYAISANTQFPTASTWGVYLSPTPPDGVYWLRDPRTLPANRLVKVSEGGEPAFTASKWAYAGQEQNSTFYPENTPAWQEVKDDNNNILGRVAYAIWDESGKLDLNMAGPDTRVNGLAPHSLGFESMAGDPSELLLQLEQGEGRERSNFAMREIAQGETQNRGDDRRFFTPRQLLESNLLRPEFLFDAGVTSQDFDVRPEWTGDRSAGEASKYLRSFLNNGRLFEFFSHPRVDSRVVTGDSREVFYRQRLSQVGLPADSLNLDAMRLLALLRNVISVWESSPSIPLTEKFTDADIFGQALNLIQGTTPPADENLVLFDRKNYGTSFFLDPSSRVGVRVTPYIVATSLRAKRLNSTLVELTEYFKLWNPHAVDLSNENYYVGHWSGAEWSPTSFGSIYNYNRRFSTTGPAPGHFKIVQLPPRYVSINDYDTRPLEVRTRPYLQHQEYYSTLRTGTGSGLPDSSFYATSNGPVYTAGGTDPRYNPRYVFSSASLNRPAENGGFIPQWYSFEIDDPRMGGFPRYTSDPQRQLTSMRYSWKAYPRQHSLYESDQPDGIPAVHAGETDDWKAQWKSAFVTSTYGPGYNINFGENFPTTWTGTPEEKLQRALSTFALPRRQYLNFGEISRVFANRPWQTLELDSRVLRLADGFSTLGTRTLSTSLPFKEPGETPASVYHPSIAERLRDQSVLFESVDANGTPTGRLRPIRGRISLNAVRPEALAIPLSAPYRMVGTLANGSTSGEDVFESITPEEALAVAQDVAAIRPIRQLSDLGRLNSKPGIQSLRAKYTGNIADAVLGRLAQFGTVRQQIYTVELIAQSVDPANPSVVTGEARRLLTVHLDTYSRRVSVQSVQAGAALGFAVDASNLPWTTGGDANWVGEADESTSNGHVARSGMVNPGEKTWIETVVQGPGKLSYRRQVFSAAVEPGVGTFKVEIDDAPAAPAIESVSWETETIVIPDGTHRVRWTYTGLQSPEDDEGAWLDQVSFVPTFQVFAKSKAPLPGAGEAGGLPTGAVANALSIPAFSSDGSSGWKVTFRDGKKLSQAIVGNDGQKLFLHLGSPVVDESGGTLPELSFASFRDPVFAPGERFALLATVRGRGIKAANNEGLWTGTPGNLRRIAMEGGAAPGIAGAVLKKIESIALSDTGSVYFVGRLQTGKGITPANDRILWVWSPDDTGSGTTTLALREGSALPDGNVPVQQFQVLTTGLGSPGEGRAATGYTKVAVLTTLKSGIQQIGTVDHLGAWQSAAATGLISGGVLDGLDVAAFGIPDVSTQQAGLAALAHLKTGVKGAKTLTSPAVVDTSLGLVTRAGDVAPGTEGAVFASFSDPIASDFADQASIAFLAALQKGGSVTKANDTGIWALKHGAEPVLELIAREGDAAPGWTNATFLKFLSSVMVPGKGPLFMASVDAPKSAARPKASLGIWMRNHEGNLQLLLREGDELTVDTGTRTVRKFTLLSNVAGSAGQQRALLADDAVICLVYFTDGTQAVLRVALP